MSNSKWLSICSCHQRNLSTNGVPTNHHRLHRHLLHHHYRHHHLLIVAKCIGIETSGKKRMNPCKISPIVEKMWNVPLFMVGPSELCSHNCCEFKKSNISTIMQTNGWLLDSDNHTMFRPRYKQENQQHIIYRWAKTAKVKNKYICMYLGDNTWMFSMMRFSQFSRLRGELGDSY